MVLIGRRTTSGPAFAFDSFRGDVGKSRLIVNKDFFGNWTQIHYDINMTHLVHEKLCGEEYINFYNFAALLPMSKSKLLYDWRSVEVGWNRN
jgi:hypothetical protein